MQDRSRYEEALLVDPDDCEHVLFWWPGGDGSGVVRLDVRLLKGCYPIRVILTDVVFTRGSNQAKFTAATHTFWPQLSSSCGQSRPFLRSRSRPPAAMRKCCWSILTTVNTFSFVASWGRGYMSSRKRRTDEGKQCAGHKASLRQRRLCSRHEELLKQKQAKLQLLKAEQRVEKSLQKFVDYGGDGMLRLVDLHVAAYTMTEVFVPSHEDQD